MHVLSALRGDVAGSRPDLAHCSPVLARLSWLTRSRARDRSPTRSTSEQPEPGRPQGRRASRRGRSGRGRRCAPHHGACDRSAVDGVAAGPADEQVAARSAEHTVCAGGCVDANVAGPAEDEVGAAGAAQNVGARYAELDRAAAAWSAWTTASSAARPATRWSTPAARDQLRHTAARSGVRRRFVPHQLRDAHAVGSLAKTSPCSSFNASSGALPSASPRSRARNRQRRDHRRRSRPARAVDASSRPWPEPDGGSSSKAQAVRCSTQASRQQIGDSGPLQHSLSDALGTGPQTSSFISSSSVTIALSIGISCAPSPRSRS